MHDWTPAAPPTLDPESFASDTELIPIPGLLLALLFLAAGGAARPHLWPRIVLLLLAVVSVTWTLLRSFRFNRQRVRARGREHRWSELLTMRSYEHRGARFLVLTFRSGVITASSRMWRFGRLAAFVGAGMHEQSKLER